MKFLETRIVPPIVMVMFGLIMWVTSNFTPAFDMGAELSDNISKAFLIAGLLILFVAAFNFIRAKTTLNPMHPESASALLTTGLYNFSRNPIYVADVLFLLSWGFFLSNIFAIILIVGFMPYLNRFQIEPEEHALEHNFGQDYLDYKARVRRWI